MADEENKPGEPSKAGEGGEKSAPVTEKAVPAAAAKETSEYVVTVHNKTGMPTKIERLDAESGERKELSAYEYAAMAYCGMAVPAAMSGMAAEAAASSGSAAVTPLIQAYWNGYADYLKALTSRK